MEKERVLRLDKVQVSNPKIDEVGFLHVDATVTRAGVFKYVLPNGNIRREFRPPEEVFSERNLKSIEKTIVTNEHPPKSQRVTSKNVKQFGIGFADSNVRIDGNFVRVGLVITDDKAIEEINNNQKREVSCGYDCYIDETPGVWDGPNGPEPYDVIQRGHFNNHIAVTKQGRAGKDVRLHLDSAIQIDDNEECIMTKFEVDGMSLELEPGTAALIKSAIEKRDSQLQTKDTEIASLQGERDQLKETLRTKELEKKDSSDDEIRKLVRDRINLIQKVTPLLSNDEMDRADSCSDGELKKMCLLKHTTMKQEDLESKNQAYIDARFDALLEMGADVRKQQFASAALNSVPTDYQSEINKRLNERIEKSDNAWKRTKE